MPGEAVVPVAVQDPYARLESEMQHLAAAAATSIGRRLGAGEDAGDVVAEVVGRLFGTTGADPADVDRIAATVRAIIGDGEGDGQA
jgi:hypothetical protein